MNKQCSKQFAIFIGFLLFSEFSIAAPPASLQDLDKQLVVDVRVIDQAENVKLVLGQVKKHPGNPLFQADKPWENSLNNLYPNVIYDADDQLYRMWYKCVLPDADAIAKLDPPRTIHKVGWLLLYATSCDGIKWDKPLLGLHKFDGSTDNNAVARDTPNVGVFKDTNPNCPPDRLYKMVYDVGLGNMRVRFSPDGKRWTEPIIAEGLGSRVGDTHNNAFWDLRLQRYVLISRIVKGMRLVSRSESDDFIHWHKATLALTPRKEEGDSIQAYCMPSFAYGSGYFGYVMMYKYRTDATVNCELVWSSDSVHWKRLFPGQYLIPRGPDGAYDSKLVYAQANPPIVRDGQMSIYYGGDDYRHSGWKRHCLPCLATLPVDRFAGYRHSGHSSQEGVILTRPLQVTTDALTLSADVEEGELRVELLNNDEDILATSKPIKSNVTGQAVQWNGDYDFSSVHNKRVKLRFRLDHATLYAFRGVRPYTLSKPVPGAKSVIASFDQDSEGWKPIEHLDHKPEGGIRGGFVRVSREIHQPYLSAIDSSSEGTFIGDWPKIFGGVGVQIAYWQRASEPNGFSSIDIFRKGSSQWSYPGLPEATSEWKQVSTLIQYDWTDEEATAAGWKPATKALSWKETVENVSRLVVYPEVKKENRSFDIDEVSLTTIGDTSD